MNKTGKKDAGSIVSSTHNRRVVQVFSLMIPTSIHSNIAARPANFRFFLDSCFSFFHPLPLSFEDGERVGVLALMDYLRILLCGFVFV